VVRTPELPANLTRRSLLANTGLMAACACVRGTSIGQVAQPSQTAVAKQDGSTSYPYGMKHPYPYSGLREKAWRPLHDTRRAIWAPEIHFLRGDYYICLSIAPTGISILKSTTGKPEGPYVHAFSPEKPIINAIDPTLFEDEDGKVYFTASSATRIVRLKDDLTGLAEDFHPVTLADPDHTPTHHAERCVGRGSNDLGTEGAVLFKANGRYYLGAADDYGGHDRRRGRR
jgi:beta-xylosidase